MSTGLNLLLAGVAVVAMCVTATAAAKRHTDSWNYYHFDGRTFIAGQPGSGAFVALRDGARPVVLAQGTTIEVVALPPGTGAIAGICYIQSSGGKLADKSGFAPSPGAPVQISANNRIVATARSDEHGYFVAVVDAGEYTVAGGPAAIGLTVEKGKTTLVPLRTGKRMVD
jgi:hypothetical protein